MCRLSWIFARFCRDVDNETDEERDGEDEESPRHVATWNNENKRRGRIVVKVILDVRTCVVADVTKCVDLD